MVTRLRTRAGRAAARVMPTWPPHALPTQSTGAGDAEVVERFDGSVGAVVEGEVAADGVAGAVAGAVDGHHLAVPAEGVHQRAPATRVHPQAVPQQRRRPRADPR